MLDFQEQHDRAWDEQEDGTELLATAIGPRHYGEDALRECGQDTGGEQSTGKLRTDDGVLLFIARRRACGVDSTRTNSPRRYWRVTAREKRRNTIGGDLRVAPAASREVEVDFFEKFTELPLLPFFSNYSQIF